MSLCDRLAAYFHARAGQWIDAHELLQVAGFAAWRTRVSELRKPPYNMAIENKVGTKDGYRQSFYRFVPGVTGDRPSVAGDNGSAASRPALANAGERPAPARLFPAEQRTAVAS